MWKKIFQYCILITVTISLAAFSQEQNHSAVAPDQKTTPIPGKLYNYPTVAEQKGAPLPPIADRIQVVPSQAISSKNRDIERKIASSAQQMLSVGFIRAESFEVNEIDYAISNKNSFLPVSKVENTLTFALSSVADTWLEDAELIGVHAEGGYIEGKRTAATRLFKINDTTYALFSETDFDAMNSRAIIREEHVNFEIGRLPGSYVVLVDDNSKAQSEFTWHGGSKRFKLIVNDEIFVNSEKYREIKSLSVMIAAKELGNINK